MSEEEKKAVGERMRKVQTGRKWTAERKAARSKALMGNSRGKGHKMPDDVKQKISDGMKRYLKESDTLPGGRKR